MTVTPRSKRILLVDGDREFLAGLSRLLADDGFTVDTAQDGLDALRHLEAGWPDLLITALRLPGIDGMTLAQLIKERADLPIIVLSGVESGDEKTAALEEVAEDYVTKPFHYPELRARIKRVLNRMGARPPSGVLRLGPDLTLELHRGRAIAAGQPVALTSIESRLLYVLASNIGNVVQAGTLLDRGWAKADVPDPSAVWAAIRRLRHKLERDPEHPVHLETVRGAGYRLVRVQERRHSASRPVRTRTRSGEES